MSDHVCIKETEIALQGKDIRHMKQKIDHIDEKLDKLVQVFNGFESKLDDKYEKKFASKFTEKAIIWVVTLVI